MKKLSGVRCVRVDKTETLLCAYEKMLGQRFKYCIIRNEFGSDIGFATIKDIQNSLLNLYIPSNLQMRKSQLEIKHKINSFMMSGSESFWKQKDVNGICDLSNASREAPFLNSNIEMKRKNSKGQMLLDTAQR